MSFAATIMARLGLDTKGFTDGMRTSNAVVDQHERKINNTGRAHDNLLRSSHRVSRQLENFNRTLLSGGDAADVLAVGLEGIGRSLNISLGALAILGAGAVGLVQIHKLTAEFEKINTEVEKLLKFDANPDFKSLSALEQHLSKIGEELDKIKGQQKGSNWFADAFRGGGMNALWDIGGFLTGANKARSERASQISGLEGAQDADQRSIATKRRRKNGMKGDKFGAFDPNNSDEFIEAATPGPKQNGYLAPAIAEELANGLRELLQTIIKTAEDKTKLSLSDLAAGPRIRKSE
jgi:hypothetical protein